MAITVAGIYAIVDAAATATSTIQARTGRIKKHIALRSILSHSVTDIAPNGRSSSICGRSILQGALTIFYKPIFVSGLALGVTESYGTNVPLV